jgi:predicted 3-demethylubiquinone-9 3-methyltransferase (glyoxalase superfamily)
MTNNKITPFLWFDNQAEDAAKLYTSLFKNSKIESISRYGKEGFEIHGQKEGTVQTVAFQINGLSVTILNGGPMFKINPSISFFVLCESIKETDELWNILIEGGKALMPIDKYPWSERYGWLQDRFGLTWQVSVVNNEGDKQKITPSLLFTNKMFGKAEEAVKFYTSVFENSSTDTMILYPEGDNNSGKVMYSEFKLNNYQLIAMDGPGVHDYSFNEAVSFQVFCDTQEEIDYYWTKLTADGGQESMCGWLKDKFGVSWQIIPTILPNLLSDTAKAGKITKAFLQMKKFDIEKLLKV